MTENKRLLTPEEIKQIVTLQALAKHSSGFLKHYDMDDGVESGKEVAKAQLAKVKGELCDNCERPLEVDSQKQEVGDARKDERAETLKEVGIELENSYLNSTEWRSNMLKMIDTLKQGKLEG